MDLSGISIQTRMGIMAKETVPGSGLDFVVVEGDGTENNYVLVYSPQGNSLVFPSWIAFPLKLKKGIQGTLFWNKQTSKKLIGSLALECQLRQAPYGNPLLMIGSDEVGWIWLWKDWNSIIGLAEGKGVLSAYGRN
jgi:hypothetical protein